MKKLLSKNRTIAFLCIFYFVGFIGLTVDFTSALFTQLTPIALLLSISILFLHHGKFSQHEIFLFSTIAFTGFLLELTGVRTGLVFGNYSYGDTMGMKIGNTPLLIGINWLMLIYCVYTLIQTWRSNVILKLLLGAAIMVFFDLMLEPAAIRLGMWNWQNDQIPIKNYVSWFIISFIFLSILQIRKVKIRNPLSVPALLIQFIFFSLLNLSSIAFS